MENTPKIRHAKLTDLKKIVEIYNQAIRSKTATGDMDEFVTEERVNWFHKFSPGKFPIFVAEIHQEIIGYATLSPYRPGRKAMNKVGEISFYIDFSYRKMGIGSFLISHVLTECKKMGKQTVLAILLDINTASIGLLKKFKFEKWGHLPNIIDFDGDTCGHLIFGLKLEKNNGKIY